MLFTRRKSTLCCSKAGFTLIELSIVLVIIGLIVGGVLVGRNLIDAAAVRAQISQIEKFNTAVNTFYGKYGYLPGDMPPAAAATFNFAQGDGTPGNSDGNGAIEECTKNFGLNLGCETMLFWVHLSQAGLIEGAFNLQGNTVAPDADSPTLTSSTINQFMPEAKIGNENYVAIFYDKGALGPYNYFFIGGITNDNQGTYTASGNITSAQAYAIDNKIDDGKPGYGKVLSVGLKGSTANLPGGGQGGAVSGGTCLDSATSTFYNLAYTAPACQLLLQFQ